MNEYMITFGMELSNEQLEKIEKTCNIPTQIGTVYISAKSPSKAMKIFIKQYGIKRFVYRSRNILQQVYIVRPSSCDSYVGYRIAGLKWSKDFTELI